MARCFGAKSTALVAVSLAGLLLVGCAAGRSIQATVGGWFGATRAAEQRPRAYYSAAARVKLKREPVASSQVVGELALHEKVLGYQVEDGFMYVTAEKSGRRGWVRERDLIERLPVKVQPSAKPKAEPAPPEQPPPEPEELPEQGEPPDPVPQPAGQPREKSIFDPY